MRKPKFACDVCDFVAKNGTGLSAHRRKHPPAGGGWLGTLPPAPLPVEVHPPPPPSDAFAQATLYIRQAREALEARQRALMEILKQRNTHEEELARVTARIEELAALGVGKGV